MRDLNRRKSKGIKPKTKGKPRSLRPSRRIETVKTVARAVLLILGAALIGAGGGLGVRELYDFLLTSPVFVVKSIEVSGGDKLDRNEILKLAGVVEGQNIFQVNAEKAVLKIAAHPWVKGVTVRRQFPDRVIIRVVEREAESLVRRNGLWLMDAGGVAFKPVQQGDPVDMPIIVGPENADAPDDPEAIKRALDILKLAKESGLLPMEQISEVAVLTGGAMTLLTTGIMERVELGRGNLKTQWATLETVLADVKRSGLEVVKVDLNYTNGAAVRIRAADPSTLVAVGRISGQSEK